MNSLDHVMYENVMKFTRLRFRTDMMSKTAPKYLWQSSSKNNFDSYHQSLLPMLKVELNDKHNDNKHWIKQ